jgi:hypothetical protein
MYSASKQVFCTVCNDRGICTACVRGLKDKVAQVEAERRNAVDNAERSYRSRIDQLQQENLMLRIAARTGGGGGLGGRRPQEATPALAKEVIAAARRTMAGKYHPDKTKDGGQKMKEVNATCDWLEKAVE